MRLINEVPLDPVSYVSDTAIKSQVSSCINRLIEKFGFTMFEIEDKYYIENFGQFNRVCLNNGQIISVNHEDDQIISANYKNGQDKKNILAWQFKGFHGYVTFFSDGSIEVANVENKQLLAYEICKKIEELYSKKIKAEKEKKTCKNNNLLV